MKKTLIITLVVVLLFVVAGTVFFVVNKKSATSTDGSFGLLPGSNTALPGGDGQTPRISIKGADGKEIIVKNFLALPETKEDPDNTGYYNLGYQPNETAPYLISYISPTTFFNIALLQEPIGQSRLKVEAHLLNILGLSKDEMCALNYSISVPNSVNSNYSGMNLGFSFCPGAVKLP
jgi:hypothetical protein